MTLKYEGNWSTKDVFEENKRTLRYERFTRYKRNKNLDMGTGLLSIFEKIFLTRESIFNSEMDKSPVSMSKFFYFGSTIFGFLVDFL